MTYSNLNNKLHLAFVVLTYDCNNRCKWCYAAPSGFSKKIMQKEIAKQYLKLIKELGIADVGFIGGEPTLHPDLIELIQFAKNQHLAVTLYSNGRKLAEEKFVKKIRNAGVDFINISIESTSPKEHDSITNVKGSLNETIRGIENCAKEKMNIRLMTVLSNPKMTVYKGLIDKFLPIKPLFVFFRELPMINCPAQKVLSSKESVETIETLFKYASRKNANVHFYPRIRLDYFDKQTLQKMIAANVISNSCYAVKGNGFAIDVDSAVLPCVQWINKPYFSLFKNNEIISKKEFLKRWNSKELIRARKNLEKSCASGCPLLSPEN